MMQQFFSNMKMSVYVSQWALMYACSGMEWDMQGAHHIPRPSKRTSTYPLDLTHACGSLWEAVTIGARGNPLPPT